MRGKVRDTYDVGNNTLVVVTTDRLSAFDYVLPSIIPNRGKVLTQLTNFWFPRLLTTTHVLSTDLKDMPKEFHKKEFEDRTMLVTKCQMFPYECVVRGFLSGSAWDEYTKKGTIGFQDAPKGLTESMPLYPPVFTPATKEANGHDINISLDEMREGCVWADFLSLHSTDIFIEAQEIAFSKGLLLADTKFEFGANHNKEVILCDEFLTPDSSRYWPVDTYRTGSNVPSLDKQVVRQWLLESGWDRKSEPPELPQAVIEKVSKNYERVYFMLTGKTL
jgi:phosphoribosylaminoimidazole-succinocarboxamide synthase